MSQRDAKLTVKEIADLIGMSVSSVYRYIDEGHLRAIKMPGRCGRMYVTETEFNKFRALIGEREVEA